ncbi:hypothetical protein LEP1GSC043_0136 [Leptospira weilii str. Ecochallenge]|uniref:Uncharacterized protein n=2 Tax=Leptospira weilii TaxID=28184 RepID=N1UG36_9LEPT|nr:hypothetical protein LEP1GSC038_2325 [Leptospira weilii str. 2006001855]EMY14955.1 hypothetical protein LEP1GSC043_0136 [Leptospira weilii str. Ecochallenge]
MNDDCFLCDINSSKTLSAEKTFHPIIYFKIGSFRFSGMFRFHFSQSFTVSFIPIKHPKY